MIRFRVSLWLIAAFFGTGMGLHGEESISDVLGKPGLDMREPAQRADAVQRMRTVTEQHHQAARVRAQAIGWPLRMERPNGGIAELMDTAGDAPVYYMTHNANAAISTGANLLQTSPYQVDGTGLTVGEWDGGGARTTHQELTGRVTIMDGAALADHSTHVCGTIAASGVVAAAKGMAPAIHVDSYEWTNDYSEMTSRGASYPGESGKIYLSNHSYGQIKGWYYTGLTTKWYWYGSGTTTTGTDTSFGRYDTYANQTDAVAVALPYYLIVRSAGNDRADNPATGDTIALNTTGANPTTYNPASHPPGDGIYKSGYDTISADAGAKDILTVGSVTDAVSGGVRSVSASSMSYYSSWGPTDDGRIKPDVVANGDGLYSSISTSDTAYATYSGTSMASPNATGTAALLVHWWGKLFPGHAMSASTLKALLIHTADDMGNPGPDYVYGWGLINAKAAADLLQAYKNNPATRRVTEDQITSSSGNRTYTFTWDGVSPIRATLCWTDPAGTAQTGNDIRTANLVNDLDLSITGPTGTQYLPWVMPYVGDWTNAKFSANATTGVNHTDNVEQVLVAAPGTAGTYTVTVSFTGTLAGGAQNFSLILNGAATNATAPAPVATTLSPSISPPAALTLTLGGSGLLVGANVKFVKSGQADVSATGQQIIADSAKVRLDATSMTSGYWDAVVTNPDGQTATLPNALLIGTPTPFWQTDFENGSAGWTHSASTGYTITKWALVSNASHSSSHSFFASGPSSKNIDDLYSPTIFVPSNATSIQLSFWHSYNLQNRSDGGVLEFSVDGGAWYDVTSGGSGASFASGGYGTTLTSSSSPFRNRSAWTGNNGGFGQVVVNLTDATKYPGHNLAMRWRLATNSSTASTGWYVDDVVVSAITPPNQAPTVVTPASATPAVVTGLTTQLSVVAADDAGESGLTYTWSASGGPPGRAVVLSDNVSNAAKTTTATFNAAGTYILTVTITDQGGLTCSSNVSVTVNSTASSVVVTPATSSVPYGGTAAFSAIVRDQFGDALSPQPDMVWSVSDGGTMDSGGVFTSTAAGGPYTVTATSGAATGNASISVTKATAAVSLDNLLQTYDGTAKAVATTTNPSGLAVSLTYNGSAAIPVNAGSYAVVGTIIDANYQGAASGTLVVSQASATVALDHLSQTYDGTARSASVATTPAGLSVSLTYDGSAIAPTNAGSYAVSATVSDPNYLGSANGTLVVAKAGAALTLGNLAQTYDGTARTATAMTNPSGLQVSLTYDGSAIAPANAGQYAVAAAVQDANYTGGASGTLTIAKAQQTITFAPLPTKTYGDAAFTLNATPDSGLPVSYACSDPSVATVAGNVVTIVGAGSGTITASQPGDANHESAMDVTQVLTVAKAPQEITFVALPPKNYGDPAFALNASANSGLAVSYASSDAGVATVSGDVLTIVGAGSATITASQTGDANHAAANDVTQVLTVGKAPQSIVFDSLPAKTFGDAAFTLGATASSGLPVSYVSSDDSVATVSGNLVTIVGVGSTVITASQAGDANHDAAADVPQALAVGKASQTITFGELPTKAFGAAPFTLGATASSGLPVGYVSSDDAVATVSGNLVTIVGVGSVEITASQAGDANHAAAGDVTQVLTVEKALQAITFGPLAGKMVGDVPFALGGSASSGLPVSYNSSNPAVATVSGNVLTVVGAGETTITASQAGDDHWQAAVDVAQILSVAPSYVSWAENNNLPPSNNGMAQDADGDGLSNLLEYALNTDPGIPNPSPLTHDLETVGGKNYLRLSVPKNPSATDVIFTVEVCGDLAAGSWTAVDTVVEEDTAGHLVVRDKVAVDDAPRRFIRLKVTSAR